MTGERRGNPYPKVKQAKWLSIDCPKPGCNAKAGDFCFVTSVGQVVHAERQRAYEQAHERDFENHTYWQQP